MVMVAGTPAERGAAATIGAACTVRGIMTAGLVLTPGELDPRRAHRRCVRTPGSCWCPAEADDLVELLRAIRA